MGLALLGACVGAYRRHALLASNGKGALATVMSYEPRKSRYTKGTTISHGHVLSFDGIVENVTLPRPQAPGMSAWQLMGGDAFWVILAGLAGSGLSVFSGWALYSLTSRAAATARKER